MSVRRNLCKTASRLLAESNSFVSQSVLSKTLLHSPAFDLPATSSFIKFRLTSLTFSLGTAAVMTVTQPPTAMAQPQTASTGDPTADGSPQGPMSTMRTKYKVAFVLGGPGSGKGTQSGKLVTEFGVVHLSAGDLLRAHMKSGSPDGQMVAEMIANGQIVPSSVTVGLLQGAMDASGKSQFLIDGFPRNDENRAAFESQTGIQPSFILFFDCPEEVMERRLLERNEGRTDDNIETIRKRFRVFMDQSLPVVQHYDTVGKVARINADRDPEDVYKEVRRAYLEFMT